jgi:hypothetical protein
MNTSGIPAHSNSIRKIPKASKKPLSTSPKIAAPAQVSPPKDAEGGEKASGSTNTVSSTSGSVLNTHA